LAALSFVSLSLFPRTLPASGTTDRHVLVISVDGMGASFYVSPSPALRIPNLLRLKKQGSFAEGVEGVYPSVTYPSHTTIVTGRLPAEHGIYTNLSSREAGKNARDWFWFASSIKVPALWDEARRNHLTTASVFWPVTAGAPINWNIPEIWDAQKGDVGDPLYVAKFATPGILFEALLELGPPQSIKDDDATRAHLATFLLKKYKPNLLLVHLANLDGAEHQYGPQSAEAAATLEKADDYIGQLLAAVRESGLERSSDVFVVSDHGFLPVETEIHPNVLLAKAGLLTSDERGSITGGKIAAVSNGGSFFLYWPESEETKARVDAALKPLREQGLLWAVFDRAALRELGAEPAAQMALEAPAGASFGNRAKGGLISKRATVGGAHGYLPYRQGLQAAFIAWGPDIRAGVDLHRIRMTEIGPTILKALGIEDSQFGHHPPLTGIFK
jgi:predicted AlkP superfamily pyrophosphatase or phosphodiesterase